MSSLFVAARTGCVDDIVSSISGGADVNAKDGNGDTPLVVGFRSGHVSIVKALISAGADINIKDIFGHTLLRQSASSGFMDMLKVFIAAGADVDTVNMFGITPLMSSAAKGYMGIVKLLIAAGADVNAIGVLGHTPLYVSTKKGHMDIAKVLIAAGAKADLTAADYISLEKEVVQALIKYLLLYQYRSIMKSKVVKNSFVHSKMWNECKKQVKEMGETGLGDSSTSFFTFMTETDENKLAFYLSKKKFGIKSKRGKISYMKKFPMYLEDIETQFKIGNERACLLLKSQKLLRHCFCYKLPPEIIGKISEFMTNEDIQSFLTRNNSLK